MGLHPPPHTDTLRRGPLHTRDDYGERTWTANLDVAVEEFTFETGPKYTSTRPTFSGTVDAGSTVSLLYSGRTLKAVAGLDKAWSLAIPDDLVALDEGQELSFRFTATDPGGNQRVVDHSVKVWTQAPVFGSISSAVTTGSRNHSFTGEVTPAAGQQFGGVTSVELTVEDPNGTVLSNAGSLTHSGPIVSGVLSLPETNGDYVMKLKATNNYGISTTVSTVVTLDTVAPSLIITEEPQLDKTGRVKVSGTWSVPGSDEVPTITVGIEDVVYEAGTVEKHTSGNNSGVWECVLQTDSGVAGTIENGATAISFVDKTYAVTATVTDSAGNVGTASGNMVVNSTAPTLSLDLTPNFQNDSTEYEVHISLSEPALKSLSLGVSTGVVDLLNPSAHPNLSLSAAVQTNSDSTQQIVVKPNIVLSDQQYEVIVTATDIYDRTTTRKTTIYIDTTTPTVTVAFGDLTTSDGIVNFSGTVQSSDYSVEVSYPQGDPKVFTAFSTLIVGDSNGTGTWSLQGTNVSYGTSSLRVKATDPAGNSSTTLHSFVHTDAAPAVPLADKGTYATVGLNDSDLNFDSGGTVVVGVVSEFNNIEYIEAFLNGEYHKLQGQDLQNALFLVPTGSLGSQYAPYSGNPNYMAIQFDSGIHSNSYVSGSRSLFVSTQPINIVSVTVKWEDHAAGTNGGPSWILRQTYQPV